MRLARLLAPVAALAVASVACSTRPRTTPDSTKRDQIVLLPDPDTGSVGRATVSNTAGTVELSGARASTIVSRNTAPTPAKPLSESDARQLFASALSTLPPAPQQFMLNFQFDSDELTPDSRALLPRVLQAVKGRPFPEVLVIGHTDTIGTAAGNIALGLKRAEMIRKLLVDTGLNGSLIEVVSHGEADLLVPTADGVRQPRNRRVEITVR